MDCATGPVHDMEAEVQQQRQLQSELQHRAHGHRRAHKLHQVTLWHAAHALSSSCTAQARLSTVKIQRYHSSGSNRNAAAVVAQSMYLGHVLGCRLQLLCAQAAHMVSWASQSSRSLILPCWLLEEVLVSWAQYQGSCAVHPTVVCMVLGLVTVPVLMRGCRRNAEAVQLWCLHAQLIVVP